MEDLLYGLNDSQREAVTTTEGIVRVIAGAGSGKTRALTHRFAYLVNYAGIMPGHILCVTFTNKAAGEMRRRIHSLIGDSDTGYINTFHGFCVTILQEESYAIKYPKSFVVLDNSDIDQMLNIIYEERGLTLSHMTFGNARDMIEMQKLKEKPEYYLDLIGLDLESLKKKYMEATDVKDIIFYGYLYQEKKCFGLDYNDLLILTLHIFETNPDIRNKWQQRLEYIMIDEFQDIDEIQYKLMRILAAYHKNLFVVGDPDQTIYTWRGANVKYINNFDMDYPSCKTIMMMENYRSTPEIIAVCNSLISNNKDRVSKDIIPTLPSGSSVVNHYAKNAEEEGKWIAETIAQMYEKGTPYKNITILYRAHYMTRNLELALLDKDIPYNIYSGVQFYDRAEIKDALSYLRMIALKDDLSFMRIVNNPRRNIGKKRMAYLMETAEANGRSLYDTLKDSLDDEIFKGTGGKEFVELIEEFAIMAAGHSISEVLTAILHRSGYEKMLRTEGSQERLDNLAELKQSILDFELAAGEECDLPYYLSHVSTFTSQDVVDTKDRVKLMTVHAAKGLEFPTVFLCCLNEGAFPAGKVNTRPGMEEERRLAFVAMTRAEERLFLTTAEGRNLDGSPRYPSRFLLDIDQSLLEYTHEPPEDLIKNAREYIGLSSRFLRDDDSQEILEVGTKVNHMIFGPGTVISINQQEETYLIDFENLDTPRAISFRAKLD